MSWYILCKILKSIQYIGLKFLESGNHAMPLEHVELVIS